MSEDVAVAAPAEVPAPSPFEALVEGWYQAWWHNLGLPTEHQNRLRQAADDLKARLAGQKE